MMRALVQSTHSGEGGGRAPGGGHPQGVRPPHSIIILVAATHVTEEEAEHAAESAQDKRPNEQPHHC